MGSSLLATFLLGASFFTVQLHSVREEQAALDSVRYLRSQGLDAYYLVEATERGDVKFKVRAGAFDDRQSATAAGKAYVKKIRMPEFFVAETDEAEVKQLALAMEPLVEDAALTSGFLRDDQRSARVRQHAQNYLVLYLLASGGGTARTLKHAAVWDTNLENHRELILVTGDRGYVLYWKDGMYQPAQVVTGTEVELYELWDLVQGPLRYLVFRVTTGGDLFRQMDHVLVRWNTDRRSYDVVGRILTEREDKGVVAGSRLTKYAAALALDDFDEDQELEVIARSEQGARVYDWNGTNLRFLADPQELIDDWVANQRMSRSLAAEALLGIAQAHAEEGRFSSAEGAWRVLVLQMPSAPQAATAKASLTDLSERRGSAQLRMQTASELLAAGSAVGAVDELEKVLILLPDYAPALYELARIHAKLGNNFEALVYLGRVIEADSKYASRAATDDAFAALRKRKEYKAVMP